PCDAATGYDGRTSPVPRSVVGVPVREALVFQLLRVGDRRPRPVDDREFWKDADSSLPRRRRGVACGHDTALRLLERRRCQSVLYRCATAGKRNRKKGPPKRPPFCLFFKGELVLAVLVFPGARVVLVTLAVHVALVE